MYRDITIWRDRSYSGHYEVKGGKLCVHSAYGSKAAPAGKKAQPILDRLAEKLLTEIVEERLR